MEIHDATDQYGAFIQFMDAVMKRLSAVGAIVVVELPGGRLEKYCAVPDQSRIEKLNETIAADGMMSATIFKPGTKEKSS